MADIAIPIYVADADASKFLIFQEHFDKFSLIIESGVLKQRNATILLDIDKEGKIRSIRRQDYLYTER